MTEGLTTIPLPPQRNPLYNVIVLLRYPPRGGAAAARRAHNPEVVGSSPTPATKEHTVGVPRPAGAPLQLITEYRKLKTQIAPGGQSEVDPPVPIPNTEVKRLSADDTARVTGCGK